MLGIQNVDTLVFEGRGVKALAYVGALQVLESYCQQEWQRPFLEPVKHVAVTSAGAILGLLIALKLNLKQISIIMQNTSFSSFVDSSGYVYGKTGKSATIYDNGYLCEGAVFMEWVENLLATYAGDKAITFAKLKALTNKDLHVYALRLNDSQIVTFNAKETPNVSVALAVRMSMSIPVFFKPVCITEARDKTDQSLSITLDEANGTSYYVEGGVKINYPYALIKKSESLQDEQILGFKIESKIENLENIINPETEKYLKLFHSDRAQIVQGYNASLMPYALTGLVSLQEDTHDMSVEESARTICCWDCNVSTLNFDLNQDKIEGLLVSGIQAAKQFIRQLTPLQTFDVEQQVAIVTAIPQEEIIFAAQYSRKEAERLSHIAASIQTSVALSKENILEPQEQHYFKSLIADMTRLQDHISKNIPGHVNVQEKVQQSASLIQRELTIGGRVMKEVKANVGNVRNVPPSLFDQAIQHVQKIKEKGIININPLEEGASVDGRITIDIGNVYIQQPLMPAAKRLPQTWNIPPQNPNFIGREGLLDKIKQYFHGDNNHTQALALTVCHGLGGVGKTQLALAFIWQENNYQNYQGVCWFNAASKETLMSDYVKLGQDIHLFFEEKALLEERARIVKSQLENKYQGWLLIYDDAANYEEIRDWLPTKGGKILITSRHTVWPEESSLALDIATFSKQEAKDYVNRIIGAKQADAEVAAVQQLITLLGCLPLALAQACAYIKRNRQKIAHYLALYEIEKNRLELLGNTLLPLGEQHESVASTWNINLSKMQAESPASIELLYACAYLHHTEIPLPLIQHLPVLKNKEITADAAQRVAQEYSMITVDAEKKTFSLHLLLQEVIRGRLQLKKQAVHYLLQGSEALIAIYPRDNQMEACAFKRLLQPHLKAILLALETEVEKLTVQEKKVIVSNNNNNSVSHVLNSEEKPVKNLPPENNSLIKAGEHAVTAISKEKAALLIILELLADTYESVGEGRKQKVLLERALVILEAHYGKDHMAIADTLTHLSMAYRALGEVQQSKALLERALVINEAHYGKDHVQVARTLNNLGNAYGALGDARQQIALLERALAIFAAHDKDHVEVAITLTNLGNAYASLGDARQSKAVLKKALAIQKKYYDKNHVEIAITLTNLGNAYAALGNINKGRELLERALAINEAHYGTDHPLVAATLINLMVCHLQQGNLTTSLSILQRTYDIFLHHPDYGEKHKRTVEAKRLLDKILFSLRQRAVPTEAIRMLENHVHLYPSNAEVWLNLADYYYNQKNLTQSIRCYKEVAALTPDDAYAHHNLACLYHVTQDYVKAEQHFTEALMFQPRASTFCDYGFLLMKQNRLREAVTQFQVAISLHDNGGLIYGLLDQPLLDNYLQDEITAEKQLMIEPLFIAHYWLIQCFHSLNEIDARQHYLNELKQLVEAQPTALHYRLLSYIWRSLGDEIQAEEYAALALSIDNTSSIDAVLETRDKARQSIEKDSALTPPFATALPVEGETNKNVLDLNSLIKLVEQAPTAKNYRLLSAAYRERKEEEQAEGYEALALSLETPDMQSAITSKDNRDHQLVNISPVKPIASSQRQEALTLNLMPLPTRNNNEITENRLSLLRMLHYQPSGFRALSTPLLFRGVSGQPFILTPHNTSPQPRLVSRSIDDDIIESGEANNNNSARKSVSTP